jgi:ABC-type dipeptide/oligopeptide/nickel transport system permease component
MISYIARRLLWTLLVLLGVAILTYLLMYSIPGSPWDSGGKHALTNMMIDPISIKALNHHYGLDQPLWRQFTRFMIGDFDDDGQFFCGLLCGRLGPSLSQRGRAVEDILFEAPEGKSGWNSRFGYTIRLAGLAFLMTVAIGLPLGVWAATHRNSPAERLSSLGIATGMSIPSFVLGLLLIVIFASELHLIPVRPNWEEPKDWFVPALILAIAPAGILARMTRTAVLENLNADYVRTARAKGLDERGVLWGHILKNASIPLLTHLGPVMFELIAASFVIELMFSFPGFGQEYYRSITRLDYPVILALTLLYGALIAIANLGSDILYAVLDPRIRLG